MSSPAVVPRARRSIAAPVVLIILGIFLLLRTMGVLHLSLWHIFARFWPLLLIVWGVVKLFEYQEARREGLRPRGIGAGGVFMVICLIIFGLAAAQSDRVNWGELRDQINIDDEDFNWFGNTYHYDDELSQAFPANASLKIVDDRGAITVNPTDDNQIKVVVRKRVGAEDQKSADKYNSQTKPQLTLNGNVLTLNANTEAAGQHAVTTDMDVYVPRKASVVIASQHGDINVNGRTADLEVSSHHGQVNLEDLGGNAKLDLEHSSVRGERIAGDVSVQGRVNDVDFRDVKGAVRLQGEFSESTKLSKIGKTVSFKSSRTDMEFSRLDGDLDLDSGDLRANFLNGPLRLATRAKDIRLDQVSGDVRLEDENGDVRVALRTLGNIQIQNRRGDVEITLPPKASFQVDARAHEGEINSEFGELKVDNGDKQASATGAVGTGGPRLVISNEKGNIEIRKGTATVAGPSSKSPKTLTNNEDKDKEPTEN